MASVGQVGLSPASDSSKKVAVSPKSIVRLIQDIIQSPQFWDGLRVFGIGAAIAGSKWLAETVWESLKSLVLCRAVLRAGADGGGGDAYQWAMLYVTRHTQWEEDARDVEITTVSKLAYDSFNGDDEEQAAKHASGGESKSGLDGVYLYPIESTTVRFRFHSTWVFATRTRSRNGDSSIEERLDLSFLTWSSKTMRQFIAEARALYEQSERGRIVVYNIDRYGYWSRSRVITRRLRDSLFLPTNIKVRALDDARRFLSEPARLWYGDRGIPYRRGFLFHGLPGTGKTSLAHVLASELQRPIYQLSLSGGLNDSKFAELMTSVPSGSVVVLEDVDCAFGSRGTTEGGEEHGDRARITGTTATGSSATPQRSAAPSPAPSTGGPQGAGPASLTFSGLLNAIDGITAGEARLLILTTNHRNRLDPALVRPGRVDVEFEFGNANRQQARELFERWYAPQGLASERHSESQEQMEEKEKEEKEPLLADEEVPVSASDDTSVTLGVTPPPVSREELLEAAEVFARATRPGRYSVAHLQGFLLARMGMGPRECRKRVGVREGWSEKRCVERCSSNGAAVEQHSI